MNPKWLALAGQMLGAAADELLNRSCNDWEFPDDWSDEEKAEFFKALVEADGNQDQEPPPLDWQVANFLGDWLYEAGTGQD